MFFIANVLFWCGWSTVKYYDLSKQIKNVSEASSDLIPSKPEHVIIITHFTLMWFQLHSYEAQAEKTIGNPKKRRISICVFPSKADDTFLNIFLECKSSLRSVDSSPMWENSNNSPKTYFIIITFTLFSIVFFRTDWNAKLTLMDPQPSSYSSLNSSPFHELCPFRCRCYHLLWDDDRCLLLLIFRCTARKQVDGMKVQWIEIKALLVGTIDDIISSVKLCFRLICFIYVQFRALHV